MLRLHGQLFPYCQQVEEGVVRVVHGIGITELKTVLCEAEHLHPTVVEVAIELLVLTRIAALVQVAPDRSHGRRIAYVVEVVGNDAAQVLLYSKQYDSIQVRQHGVHHQLLLHVRKGMVIDYLALLFYKEVGRHHQRGCVDHHQHALKVVFQQG